MTELQKVELEMLKIFLDICEQLHMTYYLVCGSALGAVKYQGFIPWDDDLDVALPRPDYERFCKEAPALLPSHIFLQNYRSDPQFPMIYSKLRHSGTTYVETSVSNLSINHGVYIDIFPLDGYPKEKALQDIFEKEKRKYELRRLSCLNVKLSWKARLFVLTERLCGVHRHPSRFVDRFEQHILKCPIEESALWCNYGNWQGKLEYAPRQQYGDGTWMKFEGLTVRIPEKFDEYLTQKYGDWRAEIPEEKQVGHHYYEVIDLERPYTAYRK